MTCEKECVSNYKGFGVSGRSRVRQGAVGHEPGEVGGAGSWWIF